MSIYSSDDSQGSIYEAQEERRGRALRPVDPRTFLLAQEEERRRDRRERIMKPVEWLFDRLSTGNYLVANIVDQAIKGSRGEETDLWNAITGSFTGEEDTTFSDVIKDNFEGSGEAWFPNQKEKGTFLGNILGNLNTAGVVGFGLDVITDPLNWITFGSTSLARKSASAYADNVVKRTLQNPDLMDVMARSLDANDSAYFRSLVDNPKKAISFFETTAGVKKRGGVQDISRKMNDLWKESYRDGISMSSDEMRQSLLGLWGDVQSAAQRKQVKDAAQLYRGRQLKAYDDLLSDTKGYGLKRVSKIDKDFYDENLFKKSLNDDSTIQMIRRRREELAKPEVMREYESLINSALKGEITTKDIPEELEEIIVEWTDSKRNPLFRIPKDADAYEAVNGAFQSVADLDYMKRSIEDISAGAGRVAFQAFRKQLGGKLRQDSAVFRSYDAFMNGLRERAKGSRLSDAVYNIMNTGPVGFVKEFLGIRNPYQRALRVVELDNKANMRASLNDMEQRVNDIFEGFAEDDPILTDYFEFRGRVQEYMKPLEKRADEYARTKMRLGEFTYQEAPGVDPIPVKRDYHYEMVSDIPASRYLEYKQLVKEYKGNNGTDVLTLARESGYQDMERLGRLHTRVDDFLKHIDRTEQRLMFEGLIDYRKTMDSYLPYIFRRPKDHVGGGKVDTRRVSDPSMLEQTIGPYEGMKNEIFALEALYGMTAEQAEAIVMRNGSSVVTDLREVLMRRGVHHTMMVSEATTLDQLRQFGVNVDDLDIPIGAQTARQFLSNDANMQKLGLQKITSNMQGAFSREGVNGYHYYFDRDVAKTINRVTELIQEPGKFKKLLSGYTNWWRSVVTTNPGFNIRNFYSNMTMLYTEFGAKAASPKYVYDGFIGAVHGLNQTGNVAEATAKLNVSMQRRYGAWTLRELVDIAKRRGIISESSRAFTNDDFVLDILRKDMRSKGRKAWDAYSPLSSKNEVFRLGRNVSATVESSSRFQAFLMKIDEYTTMGGITSKSDFVLDAATQDAKRILLDYDDLTKGEREWAKNVIPFYTWIRKNLANQMFMLHNPQYWSRMAMTPKAIELLDDDNVEDDPSNLPEYMREDGYFTIGFDEEGNRMTLWPNLPVFDLNMLPMGFEPGAFARPRLPQGSELLKTLGDAAHPILKTAVESWTGYDLFREREIQITEEADQYYGLLMKMPRLMNALDPIVAAGNDGIGLVRGIDDDGVVQFEGGVVKAVDNLFPIANALNRYLDAVETGAEAFFPEHVVTSAVEQVMGAADPYEGTEKALRTMSYMLGVKASVFDEREARLWRAMDLYNRTLDMRRAQEELSPIRNTRRMLWENRQRNTMRRLGIY